VLVDERDRWGFVTGLEHATKLVARR